MSIFIDTLKGQKTSPTPVWLMRQAGRHLPEYISIRKQFANLMDMFLDPSTILEVSLQPVNRYGMDACIVFSDILITPFAAGSSVSFIDGQGPVIKFNENMSYNLEKTLPLATGIKKIKENTDIPLIGFAGGAWTTLFYCLYEKNERQNLKFEDVVKKTSQIDNLSGPRLGAVFISASPASSFLRGDLALDETGELPPSYDDFAKGSLTTLYGWQFESRFADGYDVTGIVEWIVLVGGMERGKFLPSVSSMVGARLESGLEFAAGPNLSLAGVAMVFGVGYNFKAGDLNLPVNLAIVPGRTLTQESYNFSGSQQVLVDPDGIPNTGDEFFDQIYTSTLVPEFDYNTGTRISVTVGFNLNR